MSKNGIALVVLVLSLFGIEMAETDMVMLVANITGIVSFVLMVYNQWSRPDTSWFIFKK